MLGLFLLAGLGLTFTPCVLPMVPILSSIIVGQNPSRPRAFALSASYVAGMAITYAVVGMLMGLFGAGLNLQARLQSAPVLIVFAVLFGLFALAMFGVFNLRLSPRLASRLDAWQDKAQRSGPIGLALAGALSVLVVSPCVSAPWPAPWSSSRRPAMPWWAAPPCSPSPWAWGFPCCWSAPSAPPCCHAPAPG
ncbi:thiol:disulfide interchange protein DsbD precursor [Halomonas elongata]|uniref:Thiol:disulfide interchange protein DsbD n=1 Tax=Halomonas elongata TaxID=2746 RepID=A0A1B8P3T7_HALEL|nr:cytochrome c biogenesis protein CcdA [Halomonas elongata]OBX36907.1 thiol:disulfide interchange protein DsbD precursor [Halomonas elongata]